MNPQKQAHADHPIHALIASRWSPCGYTDRAVSAADLCSLFEAARWSASSYNEQPWSYLVATKEDSEQFARLLSCLVEGNQDWAKHAPVLAVGCASVRFARNAKPNAAALHDLGLASANLSVEATSRGLSVHQMVGILPDKVRELFGVPADVQPLTGLAIGYAADADGLPDHLRKRDRATRERKPLAKFVFGGQWGTTSSVVL